MMEEARSEQLLRIYAETRTIAVVGASTEASKAAHQVPRYLQSQGYGILPVNPRGGRGSSRDCATGHDDRSESTLAPGGDRVRGGPADRRSSRADRRHEPLYGSHSRAARPGTRASRLDQCLSVRREGILDAVLQTLLPR